MGVLKITVCGSDMVPTWRQWITVSVAFLRGFFVLSLT